MSVNPGAGEILHALMFELDADGRLLSMEHTVYGCGY